MISMKRPLITMNTPLKDIPRDWLMLIEPRIVRGPYLPCWLYGGSLDPRGNALIHKIEGHTTLGHRFVCEMFWTFPKTYRIKRTCEHMNCLNPIHIHPQVPKKEQSNIGLHGKKREATPPTSPLKTPPSKPLEAGK